MAFIGELNFYEDDCIFFIEFNKDETFSIAEFGNDDSSNDIILHLDSMNRICDLYLINTKKVYLGTPKVKEPEEGLNWNPGPIIMQKHDEDGNLVTSDDFEIYIDDDDITILFGNEDELNNNNETVSIDNQYEDDKVIYGYDADLNLKLLKIKNVSKQRHNLFLTTMKELGIPVEKKNTKIIEENSIKRL